MSKYNVLCMNIVPRLLLYLDVKEINMKNN